MKVAEPLPPPSGEKAISAGAGRFLLLPSGEKVFLFDPAAPPGAPPLANPSPPPPVVKSPAASPATTPAETEEDGYSEEIQELIGDTPGWLLRWGTSVIFVTLLGLLWLSWLLRYPEIVRGKATVTTAAPPVRLVARNGGEIQKLFAVDDQQVEAGATIAVFRSSADYRDVLRLEEWLVRTRSQLETGEISSCEPLPPLHLGDLEVVHADLNHAIVELCSFRTDAYRKSAIDALARQIEDERRLRESLEQRQALLAQAMKITERKRDRGKELADGGLLSQQDLDLSDAAFLQDRQAVELARGELVSSDVRVAQVESALFEARQRYGEQERSLRLAVRSAFHALRAALEKWQQDYLIRSPTAGHLSYFRSVTEGQFVPALEQLVAVVPDGGEATATIALDPAGAGRVAPGQRVILRFDSFPPAQFGTVEGRVESISSVTDQPARGETGAGYLVRVSLPRGLTTSYGIPLELKQEMGGGADIVTQDRRLLERIFQQLYDIATNARNRPAARQSNSETKS